MGDYNPPHPLRKVGIPDHLWDAFEEMAQQMGSERDGLINQALFVFARLNGFLEVSSRRKTPVPPQPTLNDGGIYFFPDGGIPTVANDCPTAYAYNLRSSGLAAQPLVVVGTAAGFLGRVALPDAGTLTTFAIGEATTPSAPRFWRPSVDAGTPSTNLPTVGFGFNLHDQPALGLPAVEPVLTYGDTPELRGAGYQMDVLNGFAPASVGIDQTTLQISLALPGSLALYQRQVYPFPVAQTTGADRVFVLYPSANTILDFSPTTVTYTSLNSADIGLHF